MVRLCITSYNIVPVQNPAARSTTSQLLLNSPENLLIQLGIQVTENLSGKMVMTSDYAMIYAISQSGFIALPIGTLAQQPIAMPDSNVALLASDQCGVTAAQNSAVIPVRNVGGGRITPTAAPLAASGDRLHRAGHGAALRRRCDRHVQYGGRAYAGNRDAGSTPDPGERSDQYHSQRARVPE